MTISFALYKAELAKPSPEDQRHERTREARECGGYWRMRTTAKLRPDFPVMIWTEADAAKNPSGATIFQIGDKVRNTIDDAAEWGRFVGDEAHPGVGWMRCEAVTREEYAKAMDTGRWSDGKPAKKMTPEEMLGIHVPSGDNEQGAADLIYGEQIASLAAKLDAAIIEDQDSADDAQAMLDVMTKLLDLSEKERVKAKEPHLRAGQAVDATWKGVRDPGVTAKASAEKRRNKWMLAETQRRQAIAEAQNAAAREAAQKQSEAIGMDVPPPPEVVPERVMVSAPQGRAVGAREVKVAVVVDAPLMINHLLDSRNPDADFLAYLDQRAAKAWRGKITLPGVQIMAEVERDQWLAQKGKTE